MLFLDFIKILEWLMISVGIMVIPPPSFRFRPGMKQIIQM